MTAEDLELQRDLDDLSRDVSEIKRVLDAIAGLLRDTQVSQAGTDKITNHARQEILQRLDDLRQWTARTEHSICEIARRTSLLETGRSDTDDRLDEIKSVVDANHKLFEELLGLRTTAVASPLLTKVQEILVNTRKSAERDAATGEPLDGVRIFLGRLRMAFWTAIATAALGLLFYELVGYMPWKKPPQAAPIEQPKMGPVHTDKDNPEPHAHPIQ